MTAPLVMTLSRSDHVTCLMRMSPRSRWAVGDRMAGRQRGMTTIAVAHITLTMAYVCP